jgi:hypothetical protein
MQCIVLPKNVPMIIDYRAEESDVGALRVIRRRVLDHRFFPALNIFESYPVLPNEALYASSWTSFGTAVNEEGYLENRMWGRGGTRRWKRMVSQ